MSHPLQMSFWLLRLLRPPSHTSAFWRPFRVMWFWSSPVPSHEPIVIRSCLLYAGRCLEQRHSERQTEQPTAVPFWSEWISHLHSFRVTTLQTQVSFVNIDDRASRSSTLWLADAVPLSARFRPWKVPPSNALCVALMSLSKHHSFGVNSCPVKGRTAASRLENKAVILILTPMAHCPLSTAHCSLPTADCLLYFDA